MYQSYNSFGDNADEPAGKPVVDCEKQNVCLTVHRGSEDDRILQEHGPAGFRQARILELFVNYSYKKHLSSEYPCP